MSNKQTMQSKKHAASSLTGELSFGGNFKYCYLAAAAMAASVAFSIASSTTVPSLRCLLLLIQLASSIMLQ